MNYSKLRPTCCTAMLSALLAVALVVETGCVFKHSAEASPEGRAVPPGIAASSWPARYEAPFTLDCCSEPWWGLDEPVGPSDFSPREIERKRAGCRVEMRGMHGRAPGRMMVASIEAASLSPLCTWRGDFRAAEFIEVVSWAQPPASEDERRFVEELAAIGPPGAPTSSARRSLIAPRTASTSAALLLPASEPRGVVVYLASAIGVSFDREIVGEFVNRGWAVEVIFPPRGSVTADPRWARELTFSLDEWLNDEYRAVRQVPIAKRPEVLRAELMARTLAHGATQFLSEYGYATDAAMEYFAQRYPATSRGPLIVVGASLGAISLPAVAARVERPINATVFFGGGANLARILYRGLVNVRAVQEHRGYWDDVARLYAGFAPLDAENSAPLLGNIPKLVVRPLFDSIVPGSTGWLLWERLGRPERWDIPVGHEGLFFLSGTLAGRIVSWVEAHSDVGP
ncbi:MAG TPA: hypothetical protein VG797_08795 [Phycisphaerales bacterium]|nr:hypothetical protein [Phycisphaerales bacterium]